MPCYTVQISIRFAYAQVFRSNSLAGKVEEGYLGKGSVSTLESLKAVVVNLSTENDACRQSAVPERGYSAVARDFVNVVNDEQVTLRRYFLPDKDVSGWSINTFPKCFRGWL